MARSSTYWTVQLPCKPQVRRAWDNSHPTPSLQLDAGPLTPVLPCLAFPLEPLESQVTRICQRTPRHSPSAMTAPLLLSACITGHIPWHVLHEDGQSLLGAVPQAAIVLHYALMLQVLQQLDLALQSTHLLGRGPAVTEACRPQFYLPGVSSACPSQWPQRSPSAVGTSAGENGGMSRLSGAYHNAGPGRGAGHSHAGKQMVGWDMGLWVQLRSSGNC